jgi:tetratricopeptide (TPR) repeat protein
VSSNATLYPLSVFQRSESLELLRKLAPRLGVVADGELEPLADRLGDLPWALNLAGMYLDLRQWISPADYMKEIDRAGGALQHEAIPDFIQGGLVSDESDLVSTFLVSWQKIMEGVKLGNRESLAAQQVFFASGYCASNFPIPFQLLLEVLKSAEGVGDQSLDMGLQQLYILGLMGETRNGPVIHRLLAEFSRQQDQIHLASYRPEEQPKHNTLVLISYALARLSFDPNACSGQQICETLRPHVKSAAEFTERAGLKQAGMLWNYLGEYLKNVAEYDGARAAFERAMTIDVVAFSPEHPSVARDVNNLGAVLAEIGDLAGSRAAFERALAIRERVLGPDHPEVATLVNNLGNVMEAQGDLDGAKEAYKRALAVDKAYYGPKHSAVARDVNNLGSVMQSQGDLQGARTAYERALAIDEALHGADNPDVAIRLSNLGSVLQALGNLDGAKAAYERALAITQAVYGAEHPDVAIPLNNLGSLYEKLGDKDKARDAYKRSLAIFEKFLPSGHPDLVTVQKNLKGLGKT